MLLEWSGFRGRRSCWSVRRVHDVLRGLLVANLTISIRAAGL